MHYQINNCLLKTEYAAKPTYKPNCIVLNYIKQYAQNADALDYGCGKLRHTLPLCNYAREVIAIDSKEQLNRLQYIAGEKTTITSYVSKHFSNLHAYDLYDINWQLREYDFILCTNVLSAVPNIEDRLSILRNIREHLKKTGVALISVQYRNSYFKTYCAKKDAIQFEDGWIICTNKRYSFYGMISPQSLKTLCSNVGLNIIQHRLVDGSVYYVVN